MSKEQYIALPEEYTRRELNARYREIPLKDTTSRLLRKYFNAMANLYGIIPLHKAKEIIFSLSPKLVTEDEFLAFAEIARHECEGYYILGGDELYTNVRHTKPLDREIIDVTLMDASTDLYIETKRSQQDKPYYVPDKKHLLEYSDPFYCEDTPEACRLRSFLKERCGLSDEREAIVFDELLFDIRSAVSQLPDAFGTLEKLDVRLRSRRDAERFFALYSAFHNTTRMPRNRFRTSMPRPGGRLSAGTGKFFKEPRSLLPAAAWLRIFSYQAVDKTLTFRFFRATLELPTGQHWPRGNICLGGSLCRKLKKKR